MEDVSRRMMLALSALGGAAVASGAAHAATFGNPDQPPEGAINSTPAATSNPGPQNPALEAQIPVFQNPPPTDVGNMPMMWSSFNIMPKRVQGGGWARQITATEFPAAKEVSGVNMRLGPGGIREMHWHLAGEWALMTNGRCRVTVLDQYGHPYVQDVGVGDLWFFPAGCPHSLQGLGPDGCEFLIVFDDAFQSEYNTLLLTDWFAHTPPKILGQNFGVSPDVFKNIPLQDLWIFQGKEPPPLAVDQAAIAGAGAPAEPFTFSLTGTKPVKQNAAGMVQLADSRTFKASKTIAAAIETIKPGGLRQMHWHPNADEWQYWIKGKGRMTVFNTGPRAQTIDFQPGDLGVVPKSQGHYIENIGDEDVQVLAVFRAPEYQEVDLSDWLAHAPPELVAQHLNIDPAVIARFPRGQVGIQPG